MPVSIAQTSSSSCPACGVEVVSEIWLIVHRHERPKLWSRAAELRTVKCPNGHVSPAQSPLLLFDPGCPFLIYSPRNSVSPSDVGTEGNYLLGLLWNSLPPEEKNSDLSVKVIPTAILPIVLLSPEVNVGDMAPGATPTDEALRICSDMHSGRASLEQLQEWANDTRLPAALRAGIRFELATFLGRAGDEPQLIEEAIFEWREVLQSYPRTTSPRRWAIACLELAQCYATRREANPTANLREAMRLLDAALEVLTEERYPEDFALAQSRRANLFLDMGSTTALIDQSLSAFEASLRVYTRESYPEDWGLVLSNMATAYLTRGGYSELDDLRRAVALMEQSLLARTKDEYPYEWAITQMNLGLTLSRLPSSEKGNPQGRAIEALRGVHDVLRALGDESGQLSAAYNLGLILAQSEDASLAEEAINSLEESLPWLIASKQTEQAAHAISFLSDSYITWLHSETVAGRADEICRRALASFKDHSENESGMHANNEVGLWLLRHAENSSERLELAGVAFERVLSATRSAQYAEQRAGTLANMATVLLLQQRGNQDLNRVRARDCLNEALRILRSLPATPRREEAIGLIVMNKVRSGLGDVMSDS